MQWIKPTWKELFLWHRWFAWFPVTVFEYPDGAKKRVWLEWVERCGEVCYAGTGDMRFNYRLPSRRKQ